MDFSSASLGFVRDGPDVDGTTAVEVDAVLDCWLPEMDEQDVGFN